MTIWKDIINEESHKDYYKHIKTSVSDTCYPGEKNIYRALKLTLFEDVRVVILGQDPYHGGQANGLAFAVNEDATVPPSLQNIFKEISNEYGREPQSRTLEGWAKQGVLLLNAILTVEPHQPLSHKDIGWEQLTDRLIIELDKHATPKVFMLWGKYARQKKAIIHNTSHLILETTHPSPFSAHYGFMGCGHFKMANDFLMRNNLQPITWA